MSDFLGRLVARSLDRAADPGPAPVRPLLPSRFEPLTPAAAPAWGENVVEETAPPPPAHRVEAVPQLSRAEIRRAAEEPRTPHPPGPPLPSPSLPPGEGRTRDREIIVRETSFLPSPGRGESDGRGAGGEGPTIGTRTPLPPQSPVPGAGAPSPEDRVEGRWERGAGSEVSERNPPPVPHSPPSPSTPPEPRPRIEPVVRRIEVEKILAPSPAPPAPAEPVSAIRPAPPAAAEPIRAVLPPQVPAAGRDPFPAQRETPAPETVIQVTIGRIEVKATPAPKAPARERPAARTAIDLDEYLKQRARGER